MRNKFSAVTIIKEDEVAVRALYGVVRFITIAGLMPEIPLRSGSERNETYTCLVGPALNRHQFLGAVCLPSISGVEPSTLATIACSIESAETEWDEESGRVEVRIGLCNTGGAGTATILFSVTILGAA